MYEVLKIETIQNSGVMAVPLKSYILQDVYSYSAAFSVSPAELAKYTRVDPPDPDPDELADELDRHVERWLAFRDWLANR